MCRNLIRLRLNINWDNRWRLDRHEGRGVLWTPCCVLVEQGRLTWSYPLLPYLGILPNVPEMQNPGKGKSEKVWRVCLRLRRACQRLLIQDTHGTARRCILATRISPDAVASHMPNTPIEGEKKHDTTILLGALRECISYLASGHPEKKRQERRSFWLKLHKVIIIKLLPFGVYLSPSFPPH